MNIAITGATGFIGRHLVKRLEKDLKNRLIFLNRKEKFDITNFDSLASLDVEVDCIIHLAAKTFTPDSYRLARDFIEVNVQGTANILELARIKKARVIFFSSYIYGVPKYLPVDEEHPSDMFNPYSATKYLGESICNLYANSLEVPVTIVRPFNVYGAGQGDHFLIPKIIKQAKTGEVNLIDPRPKRDYIYIDDLIDLIVRILEKSPEKPFEVFNAGTGKSTSIDELVQTLKKIDLIGNDFKVTFSHEYRSNEVLDTVASIEKANKLLGWTPKTTLAKGLEKMIECIYKTKKA